MLSHKNYQYSSFQITMANGLQFIQSTDSTLPLPFGSVKDDKLRCYKTMGLTPIKMCTSFQLFIHHSLWFLFEFIQDAQNKPRRIYSLEMVIHIYSIFI